MSGPTTHEPMPVVSVAPISLPAPGRAVDLQVRVSAPVSGENLPVVLLSHGHGASNNLSSLNGYGPLANAWAAQGFVVVQPTHLDSATLSLDQDDPDAPLYWRARAADMTRILDRWDAVEAAVPGLTGRTDPSRVAAAGHSLGGHTTSLLLGARLTDPQDGSVVDLSDPRVSVGVLLAGPGRGGDALSAFAAEHYPFFATTDFSTMTTPALVVVGEKDDSPHLTVAGPDWHADPHHLSPAETTLLTVFGAEHGLGGISGYDVAEATDENPARVAAVARLSAAYLTSAFRPGDPAWRAACDALTAGPDPVGRVESDSGR